MLKSIRIEILIIGVLFLIILVSQNLNADSYNYFSYIKILLQKNYNISPNDIAELIKNHYTNLMQAFYESQSSFLCGVYKKYHSEYLTFPRL